MPRLLRTIALAGALAGCVAPNAATVATPMAAPVTTVILVRHAEKEAEPAADPALTAAGRSRADALAEMVKHAGVDAIVSTRFQRTRLTAAPVAALLGLTVEIIEPRAPTHARDVADAILARHRGGTVLVVGDSNTVPAIVAALGAALPPPICDAQYDNVYVVTIRPERKATLVRARYGAASGSC
ncbi:MAG: histidine phosphatase family protein [Gemmatimonadaceae bacterium]|nr:histidine phosphatase family protein [Gemmatimonadaceae bacterium]